MRGSNASTRRRTSNGAPAARVSPWEGHPSEECHRIFAGELLKATQPLPCLKPYVRDEIAQGPAGYGSRSRP
jgi:hypothetical protein